MRATMNARKPDVMPMTAYILREKKHRYIVVIKFIASKRIYETAIVHAPNQKAVKAQIMREFPHMKWGKK
jgi:hypothetical protein